MKWRIKATVMLSLILLYLITALPVQIFVWGEKLKRQIMFGYMKFYSRIAVWVLGVEIKVEGEIPSKNVAALYVSNHMSYLDIIIFAAVSPSIYITSVEVGDSHGLGWISKLASCIFVERRDRSNVDNEIKEVERHFAMGLPVGLCPEGTSTNGKEILKFKRTFFDPAINTQTPVLPMCLRYTKIDGVEFSEKNADKVCWYGKMTFMPHFNNFMKVNLIEATLSFLPKVEIRPDHDRRSLADECHDIIEDRYFNKSESVEALVKSGMACGVATEAPSNERPGVSPSL